MKKRKIAVVTGARATYGYSKRLMKLIQHSKRLKLQLIVTGMHLMKRYGYTVQEVLRDGLRPAAKVPMPVREDTPQAWAASLGTEIRGMAQALNRLRPDVVVVSGDRAEMLAATVTACYMNLPVAHIQSGDVSGHIDGSARHAITKLAHIHFPACHDSAQRVLRMGEEPWRIFNVGAPQLDEVVQGKKLPPRVLSERFGVDFSKPVLLVIQHPVLEEVAQAAQQMEETLAAVRASGFQALVIYPNADAGGQKIIEVIRRYERFSSIRAYRNIERPIFLSLLKHVRVLIGNSSASILEAPSFRLAAIDIGSRQRGRMRACNVLQVPDFNRRAIGKAIRHALTNQRFLNRLKRCRNPYGDGHSSRRICRILEHINPKKFLQKNITY